MYLRIDEYNFLKIHIYVYKCILRIHICVTGNVLNSAYYRISSAQLNNVQNILHFNSFNETYKKIYIP